MTGGSDVYRVAPELSITDGPIDNQSTFQCARSSRVYPLPTKALATYLSLSNPQLETTENNWDLQRNVMTMGSSLVSKTAARAARSRHPSPLSRTSRARV